MILYVMRHAEAVEGNQALADEWRYLTEKGRSAAHKVSSSISKSGPIPRLIITSPLTRAVQTAEIAALKACRKNVIVSSGLLLPGGDISSLIAYLKTCRDTRRDQPIALKKGACVALEYETDLDDKLAGFICYLVPGKKKISSLKKAFPHKAALTDAGKA